jgi:3-(3-hydroxy-phenyl)propionate hydroxylase
MLDRYFLEGFAVGLGGEYLAGRMISQPLVTNSADNSALLDEHLGEGFAILGYNCQPEEELGEDLARQWREQGVTLVGLDDRGTGAGLSIPAESHLAELFGQGKANLVLLRPDRFCMAAFDRDSAADTLAQAWQLLGFK